VTEKEREKHSFDEITHRDGQQGEEDHRLRQWHRGKAMRLSFPSRETPRLRGCIELHVYGPLRIPGTDAVFDCSSSNAGMPAQTSRPTYSHL